MGVVPHNSDLTPCCNDCGVFLCQDITPQEYEEHKEFWDGWKCKYCDPFYVQKWIGIELKARREERDGRLP
jgi:hypothetical protein